MNNSLISKSEYKKNPGWYWLLLTLFLFPLLPEYISPFILFIGFIVFKCQWTHEGRKAKVGTLGKCLMAFMTIALVSVFWSKTKLDTLGTAGLWWGMFLIEVMIYNLVNTRQKIDRVLTVITASSTINALVGVVQVCSYALCKFGYIAKEFVLITPLYKSLDKKVYTWLPFDIATNTFSDRASGCFSNPNLLATNMIVAYPISIYLFLNGKTKKQKITYFLANLAISAGMSSTLTRAGCIIAIAGWVFMFVILAKRHAKKLLTIFIPTVAVIVPSLLTRYGVIFNKATKELVNEKHGAAATASASSVAHFEIWKSVFDYITHHINAFLIGLGFGCQSTGDFLVESYKLSKPHAHNFVLEIWSEIGIIGIIAIAIVIGCAIGKLLEINASNGKKFDLVFCVLTSFILLLLFGLTDYIFNSPKQIIYFTTLLGITQAISQCYDKTLIKSPHDFEEITIRDLKRISELNTK